MSGRIIRPIAIAALFAVNCAAQAQAQTLGTATDAEISIWRIVLSFLLCVLVAVAAALFMRARMGGLLPSLPFSIARPRRLKVVESVRLSATSSLSIVDCDGREMLFLVAGGESKIVADLGAAAVVSGSAQERPRHA